MTPIGRRKAYGIGEYAPAFHVMAKPTGSNCNLDCAYCFYLKKEQMYPEQLLSHVR